MAIESKISEAEREAQIVSDAKARQQRVEKCERCHFFSPFKGRADIGQCRKYVPKVHQVATQRGLELTSAHPSVNADEWCGEFQVLVARGEVQ